MNVIRILDKYGDTELSYDPKDKKSAQDIESRFKELMERGFVAFDVSSQPGRIVDTFDSKATEVIVTPRFAGG